MKLVVGFGNPGTRYNFTRHNLGFLALDFYFKVSGVTWESSEKFGAVWGRVGDTLFIKSQGFYNNVGETVQKFMHFYKIPISDVLVVCDDFNLEFGKIRYRSNGSAGGNNGLKSIISVLSSEDFARLRVGTENSELRRQIGDVDFVLSKFTAEEKTKLPEILSEVNARIDDFSSLGSNC